MVLCKPGLHGMPKHLRDRFLCQKEINIGISKKGGGGIIATKAQWCSNRPKKEVGSGKDAEAIESNIL